MAGEGHIPLAASPEPQSAAAISGMSEVVATKFDFAMTVHRIAETSRTTRPYTDAEWNAINEAGELVDKALVAGDVRLTMGGEPTFVAATNVEADEWNTAAMGPTKRGYAGKLIRRLAKQWSPGAVLHHGMGKLYPGEQLPRWALSAHWRADEQPVWLDSNLLADPERDRDTANADDAGHFARALAERLQVDPTLVLPAYEDVHYFLWKEHRLPANVVAEDSRLRDELERARMARVFGQGLASPVGSVLPLRRAPAADAHDGKRWQGGQWHFRDGTMFLVPGDSPIGFRLPLDSLPWTSPELIEHPVAADPFAPSAKLPAQPPIKLRHDTVSEAAAASAPPPEPTAEDAPDPVRTALTVEPRDGLLHVFLPPLYEAEAWLDLISAIEATAPELGRKVVHRGLCAAGRSRIAEFLSNSGPWRDRGQHPSRQQLGRLRGPHRVSLRGSAASRHDEREVHA